MADIQPRDHKRRKLDNDYNDHKAVRRCLDISELLELILHNLTALDLVRCLRVSHTFQDTIYDSPKLQARIFYQEPRVRMTVNPLLTDYLAPAKVHYRYTSHLPLVTASLVPTCCLVPGPYVVASKNNNFWHFYGFGVTHIEISKFLLGDGPYIILPRTRLLDNQRICQPGPPLGVDVKVLVTDPKQRRKRRYNDTFTCHPTSTLGDVLDALDGMADRLA